MANWTNIPYNKYTYDLYTSAIYPPMAWKLI